MFKMAMSTCMLKVVNERTDLHTYADLYTYADTYDGIMCMTYKSIQILYDRRPNLLRLPNSHKGCALVFKRMFVWKPLEFSTWLSWAEVSSTWVQNLRLHVHCHTTCAITMIQVLLNEPWCARLFVASLHPSGSVTYSVLNPFLEGVKATLSDVQQSCWLTGWL